MQRIVFLFLVQFITFNLYAGLGDLLLSMSSYIEDFGKGKDYWVLSQSGYSRISYDYQTTGVTNIPSTLAFGVDSYFDEDRFSYFLGLNHEDSRQLNHSFNRAQINGLYLGSQVSKKIDMGFFDLSAFIARNFYKETEHETLDKNSLAYTGKFQQDSFSLNIGWHNKVQLQDIFYVNAEFIPFITCGSTIVSANSYNLYYENNSISKYKSNNVYFDFEFGARLNHADYGFLGVYGYQWLLGGNVRLYNSSYQTSSNIFCSPKTYLNRKRHELFIGRTGLTIYLPPEIIQVSIAYNLDIAARYYQHILAVKITF